MTQAEFEALYAASRKSAASLTIETMQEIKSTYISASKSVEEAIKNATLSGANQLSIDSLNQVKRQIDIAAGEIRQAIDVRNKQLMLDGMDVTADIHVQYLDEILMKYDQTLISIGTIKDIYVGINQEVMINTLNRMLQDRYTYSERLWGIADSYKKDMENIINSGLLQGRSTVEIAKDIQVYLKDGKIALANRYGALERGTKEFLKRVGNTVDWRALRLIKSELHMSLQTAALEHGKSNPACTGYYYWILASGRAHYNCACDGIAAGGPYLYEQVPAYPHPNCECRVQPVLKYQKDFEEELRAFLNGEMNDISNWYNTTYRASA